jgi:hypothetical protein
MGFPSGYGVARFAGGCAAAIIGGAGAMRRRGNQDGYVADRARRLKAVSKALQKTPDTVMAYVHLVFHLGLWATLRVGTE